MNDRTTNIPEEAAKLIQERDFDSFVALMEEYFTRTFLAGWEHRENFKLHLTQGEKKKACDDFINNCYPQGYRE